MSDTPTLGEDLKRLEEIVRRLEADDLPIEEALAIFEEGVGRLRAAKLRLAEAETRVVQVLRDTAEDGTVRLEPLDG
ncbi:MAG: exodeoxyribonuclease VII small subunit [Gemmatimonadales bacterium]|nr:exodeoxyribonuclease VII small subunit [Gemmatimonadota bacterium]MCB9505252.1 exodeoxyribonuclease VII small subunit [Gemmatimonadales bacterium]MCB9517413.1 exodeoxyribonuclease VII small subunit [Gemmatimonadales bacterium]HPF62668.1 exodeoxyribonuclease VII small subunit [Gemmatimonadales bacterium]